MYLETHDIFAKLSWILLNVILISRPLATLTKNKHLFKLLKFRKALGIICGLSAIIHVLFFLYGSGLISTFFTDSRYWSLNNFYGWGMLALILMLVPLATSNNYSIRLFNKNWKKLQQITYGVYLATAVHIAMISGEFVKVIIPVIIWAILWLLAHYKSRRSQVIINKLNSER